MKPYHGIVELQKEGIFQIFIQSKVPLTAGIFVIQLLPSRGNRSFGMSKLIAHEIQITSAGIAESDKPYHLVIGLSPVESERVVCFIHAGVHLGIKHPENKCFIPYQGLVV